MTTTPNEVATVFGLELGALLRTRVSDISHFSLDAFEGAALKSH